MASMASVSTTAVPKRRTFGELLNSDLRALPVVIALIALWAFFAVQSDIFLTPRNLSNLLQQSTVVGVMALGLMFVLLVKEIDLSIAAIHGVTAVFSAKLIVDYGFSPWLALPIAILIGAAIGSCSARWVNWVGVPSFVVTLGLGLALNGIQLLLLPATARYGLLGTGMEYIAQTTISGASAWITWAVGLALFAGLISSGVARRRRAGLEVSTLQSVVIPLVGAGLLGALVVLVLNASQGIPLPVLIFVVLLGIGGYVLNETQFGLYLYAVGNNDEAARRAGIRVPLIRMAAFAIAGGLQQLPASLHHREPLGWASSRAVGSAVELCFWNQLRRQLSAV